MSDTDPDLKPTERNRPTAIDVVDGNLIVKRHSGREESFPIGGIQLRREDWLEWYVEDPTRVSDSNQGFIPLNVASGTTLYDKTYSSVQDLTVDDLTFLAPDDGHGVELGDNFVVTKSQLYFRKPGIYVASVSSTPGAFNGGDWMYRVMATGNGIDTAYAEQLIPQGSITSGGPQLVFTVSPETTLRNLDLEPWQSGDLVSTSSQGLGTDAWQNTGTPQDLSLDIYVVRILG
jgi:hypothetical protein